VIDPETQGRVLQAIAWERRGAFLALAREALRPSEVRAADLDDYDLAKATLRVNKTIQGPRTDSRIAHTKNRTARVKEVWDQQLREWLEWRLVQATPERRLRGETALFPNPAARNKQKRWTVSGLEREWRRACARAGVDYIPLQQGTRHSILTTLGRALPERVLRDFSRHRDARSLDRYSKPRATRSAIVRAFGPPVAPTDAPPTAAGR
jgi:integrase